MSWREIARAAVRAEAEAGDDAESLHSGGFDNFAGTNALADAIAEREAIASVDGGLPLGWAASLTMIERGQRPAGISERDWRGRLDALWRRADEHGASFVANGWTFEEVFGVGEHWLRLDERGAAWLAPEARIVAIDPHRIVFER